MSGHSDFQRDGSILRAARWLADIDHWPDDPVALVLQRFALKSWEARKVVDRARRMKMLRAAHG